MQIELPFITCVLSKPTSHYIGGAQQHSMEVWGWALARPEGTSNLHEEDAQRSKTLIPFFKKSLYDFYFFHHS